MYVFVIIEDDVFCFFLDEFEPHSTIYILGLYDGLFVFLSIFVIPGLMTTYRFPFLTLSTNACISANAVPREK